MKPARLLGRLASALTWRIAGAPVPANGSFGIKLMAIILLPPSKKEIETV
jgi:hypothetical protein